MVLSLFKSSKPMISVVLTKEKVDITQEDTGFGILENRLDLINCKLRKIKKYSKKVFECNNLATLSEVQTCQEELKKKEACKAKKRVRICAPGDSVKSPCEARRKECMNQGDICEDSESGEDFDCNDINLSESDSGSAVECENEEKDICAEEEAACEEKAACEEEAVCEEEGAADEACPEEENICESKESSQEDICDIKLESENECAEETKDKKCQVMTAEMGASNYLLSQLQISKDGGAIEAHVHNMDISTNSNEKTGSVVDSTSSNRMVPNCSLVIPIITTTSAHSLAKTSSHDVHIANNCTLLVNDEPSAQPIISNYTVEKKSSERSKNDNIGSLSQVTADSISIVKQSSAPGSKKSISRSGSKINPNSRQSLKDLKNRSGTNPSLLKQEQQSCNLVVEPGDQQPSIVYIVQSPSQKSEPKLPRDASIHIEASKVYITSKASEINTGSKTNSGDQQLLNDQNISDLESDQSDLNPSVKLESRVSFQQTECLNCTQTNQGLVSKSHDSGASLNTFHHSSSKLIPKVRGSKTSNLEDSQLRYYSEETSNSRSDRTNLEVSKEDKIYVMQEVNNSNLSNIHCYEDMVCKENSQSNHGSKVSNCAKGQWDKDSLNKSILISDCGVKSLPNSFVSNCDAFNKSSQVQFISDCDALRRSQVQFISDNDAVRKSQGRIISDSDSVRRSQAQFASNCEVPCGKSSSVRISTSTLRIPEGLLTADTNSAAFDGNTEETVETGSQANFSLQSTHRASSKTLSNSNNKINPNVISKSSINSPSNAYGTKENLSFTPVQMTTVSNNRAENEESVHSMQMNNSKMLKESLTCAASTTNNYNSWQNLPYQDMSKMSQKNETIAMFANITPQEPVKQKDILVIHCNKCKQLCIAKILQKPQTDSGIWSGQRNFKEK